MYDTTQGFKGMHFEGLSVYMDIKNHISYCLLSHFCASAHY